MNRSTKINERMEIGIDIGTSKTCLIAEIKSEEGSNKI